MPSVDVLLMSADKNVVMGPKVEPCESTVLVKF